MRVYIVRHGQTEWNISTRWQGNKDIPLDDVGISQAYRLAERLSDFNIKCIYTSPLSRSAMTATIIQKKVSANLVLVDDMKEICLGEWEGYTSNQLKEKYKTQFVEWETNPNAQTSFGVENYASLQERAFKTFKHICAIKNESVLLVGHGTWTRVLICKLLNISLNDRMNFEISNTGISMVDVCDEIYRLVTLNDVSHLFNSKVNGDVHLGC